MVIEPTVAISGIHANGNALIAYTQQDGTFCLATGHLRYYECDFRRTYDAA